MKKTKLGVSVAIMAVVVLLSTAFRSPEPDKTGFTNLKILPKDISKQKLDSIMDFYKLALGVKCGHCHARKKDTTDKHLDFASDEKPEKDATRWMMTMTADINAKYFPGTPINGQPKKESVSCFTCHRGSTEPSMRNLMPQIKTLEEQNHKRKEEERKKKGK